MNQNHENRQIAGSTENVELDRFARRLRQLEPASSAPDLAEMMYRAGYRAAVAERSPNETTIPSRRTWIAGPAGTIAAALLAVAAVAPIAYRQGVGTVSSETRVTRNGSDGRELDSRDLSSGEPSSATVPNGQDSSRHGLSDVGQTPERSRDSEDASGWSTERPTDGAHPTDSGGSLETKPDRELAALASTLVAWSERVGGPREWLGIDLDPTGEVMGLGEAMGLGESSLDLIATRTELSWDGEGWPLPADPALTSTGVRRSVPRRADDDAGRETNAKTTLRANDWDRWGEWFDDPSLADGAGRAVPIR